jgi:hypothetical protein
VITVSVADGAERAMRRRSQKSWSDQKRRDPEIAESARGASRTVPEATAPRAHGKKRAASSYPFEKERPERPS